MCRLAYLMTIGLLLFTGCSVTRSLNLSIQDGFVSAHQVSFEELAGNPQFFDGQTVQLVMVAGFDFGFEQGQVVYASREDWQSATYSFLRVHGLEEAFPEAVEALEDLDGRYVLIVAEFSADKRERLSRSEVQICFRLCGSPGTLHSVKRIALWGYQN